MSNEELTIQLIKIFLGVVFGLAICIIAIHINNNLDTIIGILSK